MEDPRLVERIVRITLEIAKAHWLKHGTHISPEDSAVVTLDVLGALEREQLGPDTSKWRSVFEPGGGAPNQEAAE